MIIEPTGIPVIPQYDLMSAGWLDLDSEEDGVPFQYQRPQSLFDNDIFQYIQNMKHTFM